MEALLRMGAYLRYYNMKDKLTNVSVYGGHTFGDYVNIRHWPTESWLYEWMDFILT